MPVNGRSRWGNPRMITSNLFKYDLLNNFHNLNKFVDKSSIFCSENSNGSQLHPNFLLSEFGFSTVNFWIFKSFEINLYCNRVVPSKNLGNTKGTRLKIFKAPKNFYDFRPVHEKTRLSLLMFSYGYRNYTNTVNVFRSRVWPKIFKIHLPAYCSNCS